MTKSTSPKKAKDTGRRADSKKDGASSRVIREILFPTEPTTIDPVRIDRAIELVMARRR